MMINDNDMRFYMTVIVPMYEQLYSYILASVSDHFTAQDLTQDVFETAYKKLYQLKDRDKAKSWIWAIAANKVRAWYKEKKKQAWSFASVEDLRNLGDSVSADPFDIAELLGKEKQKRFLEIALWDLNPQIREILSMNILLEIPLSQIAEDMGINYNTLRNWKTRNLKRLRKKMEELEGGDDNVR